jgi:hypothetical protein
MRKQVWIVGDGLPLKPLISSKGVYLWVKNVIGPAGKS